MLQTVDYPYIQYRHTGIRRQLGRMLSCFVICFLTGNLYAQKNQKPQPPLSYVNKQLTYVSDSLGNRIPDFSYCGYRAGATAIPNVPVKAVVPVKAGDATARIQAAIDHVASLPGGGAVLLQAGTYEVSGQLTIAASGVVLRGSGVGSTTLLGTGKDRLTLIQIKGRPDKQIGTEIKINDKYMPVNARTLHVTGGNFKPGDKVLLRRPSTAEWIAALRTSVFGGGISALGWKPGQRDLLWDRTVVAVTNDAIELDAPITTAIDEQYGGGTIAAYKWAGRIREVGVENLSLVSEYDTSNPKDEQHRWMAIVIENTTDAWVRQVTYKHFAGSAVFVAATSKQVTVEDCKSISPVSEIGGQRRNTFYTAGQQTLFQRCYAQYGYHDFVTGFCAAGPNAFVQCESDRAYGYSGSLDSWASGVLFDAVKADGQALSFMNRGQDGNGAGWNAANSVFWNCSASRIDCYQPPTAQNWSFGCWAQFSGDGYWGESNNSVDPLSLYYGQLAERLKQDLSQREQLLRIESNATSSPTVAQAAELTVLARQPQQTLSQFIDQAIIRQPIPVTAAGAKVIEEGGAQKDIGKHGVPMLLSNGWLLSGDRVLTGSRGEVPWWSGSSRPYALNKARPAVTRYVPGETGTGLTDDLNELTDSMRARHQVMLQQNYALWYERRRDDHQRVRRIDGDVWPPFYELPFARSGKDTAWDGLSKYDLTKYNYWYWNRLQQFATLADQKGLVLVHQNYFQHNILEAGAHYADFPWRPVNNINNTGFPEPPPYAGDKRIFMEEHFYDVTNPLRRDLHRAYIRKCLDNFKDNSNVIQTTSEEYTGPLHFVQFWLDAIKEWEQETGKKALIALSVTKDVQDAILADTARAKVVNIVDIRYWHYQQDGFEYAPAGGQHLAPRQQARQFKPKRSSFDQVYRAVREYRDKFPGKAIMYSGDSNDNCGWAVFMAGGSLAQIPVIADAAFLPSAATMSPTGKVFELSNGKKEYIIYTSDTTIQVEVDGTTRIQWIDPSNGQLIGAAQKIKGNKTVTLNNPKQGAAVCWIRK